MAADSSVRSAGQAIATSIGLLATAQRRQAVAIERLADAALSAAEVARRALVAACQVIAPPPPPAEPSIQQALAVLDAAGYDIAPRRRAGIR